MENRLCSTCQKLEDEFHFVLECVRYENLRIQYIPNFYRRRPSMFKLIELFSSTVKEVQRNLALFVFKAFKVRDEYIFV